MKKNEEKEGKKQLSKANSALIRHAWKIVNCACMGLVHSSVHLLQTKTKYFIGSRVDRNAVQITETI